MDNAAVKERERIKTPDVLKYPFEPPKADGSHVEIAPGLFEAELRYLHRHEWARCANDVLWRRTKLGLRLNAEQITQLSAFMAATVTPRAISPAAE